MYYVNILYLKVLDKIMTILIMTISIVLLLIGKPKKKCYVYYVRVLQYYILSIGYNNVQGTTEYRS